MKITSCVGRTGWLGNSSVATLPTLPDLVRCGDVDGHGLEPGDAVVYRNP